ncbi:MAG TPA: hypothetical protein VMR54_07795, partial [Thermoanaerobaculia bacterium]|nr:hypothetical protein [Thermoanaerobaculia bacterium]
AGQPPAPSDRAQRVPDPRPVAASAPVASLGARPSTLLLRAAILSLRAQCSKNRLSDVAGVRLRAVFLRSRSRVGLAALATDMTRTVS